MGDHLTITGALINLGIVCQTKLSLVKINIKSEKTIPFEAPSPSLSLSVDNEIKKR